MPSRQAGDVVLIGQPNVGKSVLFSRLTGVRTVVSNYPGATVTYAEGRMRSGESDLVIVDAPGIYSLEPLDEAARVAVDMVEGAGRIINVVDSTHLERHLPLTLELIARGKPLVVALNMSDEARHQGISIDAEKLSNALGVPVVSIVARSGEGIRRLIDSCLSLSPAPDGPAGAAEFSADRGGTWQRVGELVEEVQTLHHHHHSFAEGLEEITIHPLWGSLFALGVVALSFALVRLIGEFLIGGVIGIVGDPWLEIPFGTEVLFERVLKPLLASLSTALNPGSFAHRLLIGTLVDGEIDFMQSFGVLTSGIFIPLGAVLPYLISFYFVLSLLEDIGYLPRLAVFLDSAMHRIGLHGYAIVPTLLGMGCNVPGVLATRILEGRRQRFITATLISIAVPCAALQAMIVGLVGSRGFRSLALVYGTLFIVWLLLSLVLRLVSPGFRPELLVEIPPYRLPTARALASKLWMRVLAFVREALPVITITILAVNLLYQLDVFDHLAGIAEPVVTRLWGLPKETVVPLLLGILRKDVALGMLAPLALSTKQLVTASIILAMFFPCIATTAVLFRELGLRDGLKSLAVMLASVFSVGSILNLVP